MWTERINKAARVASSIAKAAAMEVDVIDDERRGTAVFQSDSVPPSAI